MREQKSILATLYAGPHHPINETSPELRFLRGICERRMDIVDELFSEIKLFRNLPSAVDAPFGRYEGLDGIRKFIDDLYTRLEAKSLSYTPVVQTRANGRVVSELVLNVEGEDFRKEIPMFWVGDLRTADTLDEVRLYCHHTYIPGLQAYRKPIFPSAHLEMGDPNLLTGAVREYYEVLHHVPQVDVPRILNSMEPDCVFGGYNPNDTLESAHASMKDPYTGMATYIPRCVGMRYETIIDDGVNCTIEWQHIVSRAGKSSAGSPLPASAPMNAERAASSAPSASVITPDTKGPSTGPRLQSPRRRPKASTRWKNSPPDAAGIRRADNKKMGERVAPLPLVVSERTDIMKTSVNIVASMAMVASLCSRFRHAAFH